MLDLFQKLGHKTLGRFAALGRSTQMLFGALVNMPNFKKRHAVTDPSVVYGRLTIAFNHYGVGPVYRHGARFTRLYRISRLWC